MSIGNGSPIESDKYHVIRELGRGGMGVVYLAEDRQLRRQVALKVLYDYLNRDRAFVERFQEEACSVSTLHHPNIVCVHGLERAGETVAIDMELVEGVSLDQLFNTSPHVGAAIARDVLGGLAACHQIGVVHRDIKPSNILINLAGQAKITDFGLATAYASHMENTLQGGSSSGFYMGTPRYMPMQAWEGGSPEPFWDLYSFGVVLHELISGKPAFKGENPVAVMRKQLTEPLPPLHTVCPHVSPEFSQLVEALLNSCREGGALTCADAFDLLRTSPEFKALQESDTASTLPMKTLVKRRAKRVMRKGGRWPGAAVLGVVVSLLAAVGVFVLFDMEPRVQNSVSIPPLGQVFYDAQVLNGTDEEGSVWMVETDANRMPRRIVGVSSLHLWSIETIDPSGNSILNVSGDWAARISPVTASTERGQAEGTVFWDTTRDQPVLSLIRSRGHDHETAPVTFALRRKPASFTRQDFFRSIEENPEVLSLLYNQLLGPGVPWAIDIEASLPALDNARTPVPSIVEPITIDGKLNEPTWSEGAFDSELGLVGQLFSRGQDAYHKLFIRWDRDNVYLAAGSPEVSGAGFEIGIAPAIEIDPFNSGRFFVALDSNGDSTATYYQGGIQMPWDCKWTTGMDDESGVTRVELKIPIASLGGSSAPVDGRRWRLNARFTSPVKGGDAAGLPVWGSSDFKALEHGALVVFREANK